MSLVKILDLPIRGDDRGSLIAIEQSQTIPFDIKRVYYIFGTQPNVARGFHAHRALSQLLVCVSGSCDVILDNGVQRETMTLDRPDKGLLVESMIWREMHRFSDDCVLLVLASNNYSEDDYIRDYSEFKECLCG